MKLDFHSIAKKVSLEAVVGGLVTSFCGSAVKQGSAGKLEVALGIVRDVVSVPGWRQLHDAITGASTVSLSAVSKLEAQYLLSFFFFFFNIETKLLYSAVLVSAHKEVNQPHVRTAPPPGHPPPPPHRTL